MRRIWWATRPVVVSAASFGGAALVAALSLGGALRIQAVSVAGSGTTSLTVESVAPRSAPEAVQVLAAVDKDPFHPERRRPRERFRLPGERRPTVQRAPTRASLPSTMQLTGTMVYGGGGGIAMLSERGRSTRMVRVGESVGSLTLESVTSDQAVFRAANGTSVVVRVTRPGG